MENFEKIATELCDENDQLRASNKALTEEVAQLKAKTASAAAPSFSKEKLASFVNGMIDKGLLKAAQHDMAIEKYAKDPDKVLEVAELLASKTATAKAAVPTAGFGEPVKVAKVQEDPLRKLYCR